MVNLENTEKTNRYRCIANIFIPKVKMALVIDIQTEK